MSYYSNFLFYKIIFVILSYTVSNTLPLFTSRRYASSVYAVVVRLSVRWSVCPSVCLLHCPKRLNVG